MRKCIIQGCNTKHLARGYCRKHYTMLRIHGDPTHSRANYHGVSKMSEYRIWVGIRRRCFDEKQDAYPRYGGRGITICARWRSSFKAFYEDVGKRPSPKHTVDRSNNDGHYSCGRCEECKTNGWPMNIRWSTKSQNAVNRDIKLGESGYRGVSRQNSKWAAKIQYGRKGYKLGAFKTAIEAALAYNKAAIKLHGVFARLNKID